MLKRCQKLKFLTGTTGNKLSILATNVLVVARGLRKSSSMTNGMSPGRNKTALREYGTEARGLNLSPIYIHLSMRPSWASADAFSTTLRRRH
jgi:hypothetical protein